MKSTHITLLRAVALVAALPLAALPLAGCQGAGGASAQSSRDVNKKEEEILRPTEDPKLAPYRERFARAETLLIQWDGLRNDGRAVEAGVTLTISCDAHSVGDLDAMRYGVWTAQRGWATPADVLNTGTLGQLRAFVAAKRDRLG